MGASAWRFGGPSATVAPVGSAPAGLGEPCTMTPAEDIPSAPSPVKSLRPWFLLVLALGLALPLHFIVEAYDQNGLHGFPLDDPWIHLTYARNLALHGSFAYSPGEPSSAGSTSPLYTLLLGLGFRLFPDEKLLSYGLGLLFHLLFCATLWAWARQRLGSPVLALVAVLLVLLERRVEILAASGMETSLFLWLVALAFLGWARRKPLWTGLAIGLGLWVRPEALILGAVLVVAGLLRLLLQRTTETTGPLDIQPEPAPVSLRSLGLMIGPVAVLGLGYLVFNHHLGGTWLPQTFAAKTAYYRANPILAFIRNDLWPLLTDGGRFILVFLALGGAGAALVQLGRRRPVRMAAEIGWIAALILAYLIFLPYSHRFNRYLVPVLPALAIYSLGVLQSLHGILRSRAPWLGRARVWPAPLVAVASLGLLTADLPGGLQEYAYFCQYHYIRHERTGRWLARHTPKNAVIATHDIGAIAFYSERRVVDIVGLVTPEAVLHLQTPGYIRFLPRLFRDKGVTHLAVLLNWLDVDNVQPMFVADPRPEVMMVFAWDPKRTHLIPPEVSQLRGLGWGLFQSGRPDEAMQVLLTMVSRDPEGSRGWLMLGEVAARLGRLDLTLKALQRARDLVPDDPRIAGHLERLRRQVGQDQPPQGPAAQPGGAPTVDPSK